MSTLLDSLAELLELAPTVEIEERPRWPRPGKRYAILFDVYEDGGTEYYDIAKTTNDTGEVFSQMGFMDVFHEDTMPIASGRYLAVIAYWFNAPTSFSYWGDGYDEDFGFDVLKLKKIS